MTVLSQFLWSGVIEVTSVSLRSITDIMSIRDKILFNWILQFSQIFI